MGLIDVKYIRAENLTKTERETLGIDVVEGLVAVETTNPELKHRGVVIKDYVENLLSAGTIK